MADENLQQTSELAQPAINSPSDSTSSSNGKRKADAELETAQEPAKKMRQSEDEGHDEAQQTPTDTPMTTETPPAADGEASETKPMSKNQQKRLKRQAAYELFRAGRKEKRKEKRHEKQAQKRVEREAKIAEAVAAGLDPATVLQNPNPWQPFPIPVNIVIDCDFEKYMRESEIVSLSSQIVRAYSQNRKAKYQAAMWVTSFGGKLKERFETVLQNAQKNWRGVYVTGDDYVKALPRVKEYTYDAEKNMIDVIKPSEDGKRSLKLNRDAETAPAAGEPEPELADDIDQSVVYLTSESPYTLERLEANTTYVIGGIVDKNREKGLCYGRAKEHKVRTAKLPIGEYMKMQSRFVLTTNQVVEIMAKWFECGDWGEAFLNIIPKRKGGVLKNGEKDEGTEDGQEDGDHEEAKDEVMEDAKGEAKAAVVKAAKKEVEVHQHDNDLPGVCESTGVPVQ